MRAVVDTNVIFEGLTKRGGASDLVIQAWLAGGFTPCVSMALAYEYEDVLHRKLSDGKYATIAPVLGTLLGLAKFIEVHYSWRPVSPDSGDDFVVDCVMNAGAILVTHNVRDFRLAEQSLGMQVVTPAQFITMLLSALDDSSGA